MAKVYGYYQDADGDPAQIGVTATPAESEQLRDIAQRPPLAHTNDPERLFHTFPADKQTAGEIARRVEVQCDDQRFIDWMAGKGRAS